MRLVYQRKNKACILKDCWYNRHYEDWRRELQRNVGYEPLDEQKILATEYYPNRFKPHDSGLFKFGPRHIKKVLRDLGLKAYLNGLFYYDGRYHTWEQAMSLEEAKRRKK